jgi:hypothetical protein
VLRVLVALALLLATYSPSGRWKAALVVALAIALIAALPGLGMYLRRHHEPWIQEWRDPRSGAP